MKTYRKVSMGMGAWQWGYPKGHRYGIAEYHDTRLKNGKYVWKSVGLVCTGITAGNVDLMKELFLEAFENQKGSLHMVRVIGDFASEWKRLNDEEKRFFKEEVAKVIDK